MTVLDIVSLEFVRLKERKSSCNGQTLTMERSRKRQGKCSSSIPCLCPPFSFLFLLWRTQGILHRMLHFSLESFCWDLLNINFKREETEVPWKDSKSRNVRSGEDELIFSFIFLFFWKRSDCVRHLKMRLKPSHTLSSFTGIRTCQKKFLFIVFLFLFYFVNRLRLNKKEKNKRNF